MFTFSRPCIGITVQLLALLILLSATSTLFAADWVKVHDDGGKLCGKNFNPNLKPGDIKNKDDINGMRCGISGMALLPPSGGRTEFLVVHDTRMTGEYRLGIVTIGSNNVGRVNYRPLDWPKGHMPPDDLEAVSSVPGQRWQFLALSSQGQVFPLTVSEDYRTVRFGLFESMGSVEKATLTIDFPLPELQAQPQIEGLSVQRLGGRLVIAWGDRGAGTTLGILYYGLLNFEKKQVKEFVTKTHSTPIKVQYPSPDDPKTRYIADLRIDENGVAWAVATSDPETLTKGFNIGPFESALHIIRVLSTSKTPEVQFEPSTDQIRLLLRKFPARKVEAIEFVPGPDGGIAFGTDDEDFGGWLYFK